MLGLFRALKIVTLISRSPKLPIDMNKTQASFNCPKNPVKTSNNTPCPKQCCDASSQTNSEKYEILTPPQSSASDKKEYKVIKLENGLIACLVADNRQVSFNDESDSEGGHDESSGEEMESESEAETSGSEAESNDGTSTSDQKMAAAALCVGVGSFSDPRDVPGMAHFLEHMVFMGSEKFPAENDFDSFIKKCGGSDNASTDAETTCFYFECLEKNLLTALDKFAQFFIAPLMKKEAITREREAIESEFQIALPSDSSRKEQLLCSLAKPDSPVNSFAWGNLITLRDNVSEEHLYKGVHDFRVRHYSAHRMTLAIQARLPLDTLQEYVLQCFEKVPNNNLLPDDFSEFKTDVFSTPEFNRLYYVKPSKDLCQVDLTWALPSLHDKYKTKPHHYLSSLLGDEGRGSLLSYLRKKVWVLATSTGIGSSGIEHNSLYALFTVTLVLTEDGLKNLYETIEGVFAYINMLKKIGPQERIFQEIKTIADASFQYTTEETAVDMVEDLCEEMQFYPSEDYIVGSQLYYEYNPNDIETVLNHLTPDKMNIMVLTKKLPENLSYTKVETWFKTEYIDLDIPTEWLEKWKNVEPYAELQIPPENPYLTTDFSILPENENQPDYPQKIQNTPLYELWYRQDQKFKLPIAYYYFYLVSPLAVESASSVCMLDTLVNLLSIEATEDLYPACTADLTYSFSPGDRGIVIKVSGYNEKLPTLIEVISKHLLNIENSISEDVFHAIKDKLSKSYFNKLLKPSTLAKEFRLNLLIDNSWTPIEKYVAIAKIDFETMKKFIVQFRQHLFVKVLIQGNVSDKIAGQTVENFVSNLKTAEIPSHLYPQFRVSQLPLGEHCLRIQNVNPDDSNSIITNYYQSGPFSIEKSALIEIIMLIIEEPLFDILRTKEQLGYQVFNSFRDTYGILGYSITVNAQATKNTTQEVDERIEAFIVQANQLLEETTEEQFNDTKDALIKMKQCVDVHLKEEVDRNWNEIVNEDYIFNRISREIEAIKKTNLDDARKWWNSHNRFGNVENFRKLSLQVVGFDTKGGEQQEKENMTRDGEPDTEKMETDGESETEKMATDGNSEIEKMATEGDLEAGKLGDEDSKTIEDSKIIKESKTFEDNADSDKIKDIESKIAFLGDDNDSKNEKKPDDYFIKNINEFKRKMFLYPAILNKS